MQTTCECTCLRCAGVSDDQIDQARTAARIDGTLIRDDAHLEPSERRLLSALSVTPGVFVSREALRELMGTRSDGSFRGRVLTLRRKLAHDIAIETKRNCGHRLIRVSAPDLTPDMS